MADQIVPRYQQINVSDFVFEGRIWDLIVSFPDHCLSFYFVNFFLKSGLSSWKVRDVHFVTGGVMSLWLS